MRRYIITSSYEFLELNYVSIKIERLRTENNQKHEHEDNLEDLLVFNEMSSVQSLAKSREEEELIDLTKETKATIEYK